MTFTSLQVTDYRDYCIVHGVAKSWLSLMAQLVNNPLSMQETLVQFLVQEDPLEKG